MDTEPACICVDEACPEADPALGGFADLDAAIAEALLEAIACHAKANDGAQGYDTTATNRSAKEEVKRCRGSRVTLCRGVLAPPLGW